MPVGGTSLPNAEPATQAEAQGADADEISPSREPLQHGEEALQRAARLSYAVALHSHIIRALTAGAARTARILLAHRRSGQGSWGPRHREEAQREKCTFGITSLAIAPRASNGV